MRNRWMAYAIATALSLGIVGEALAQQAPGGTAPAPSPTPQVQQKQDGQTGGKYKRKGTRKRRRAKKTAATPKAPAAQTSAQPAPPAQR